MSFVGIGLPSGDADAQANASTPKSFIEDRRQQERERLLREQQERGVDVRLPSHGRAGATHLPRDEAPCFVISRIGLQGDSAARFDWSLADAAGEGGNDPPVGRCLGAEGVDIVVARVQKSIVERGYITTRVLAGPQDLSTGILVLTLVPGRIAALRPDDEGGAKTTWLRNAIPSGPDDLLELRDIEQGLENLKRLPTVDADIQIAPSTAPDARPGDSDLVVKYRRRFPLRATLSLDDTGTAATGKTQVGATVAWDGPLGLNDLAYVSINHDAFNHDDRGTGGQTVHYSIPFGYTLLGLTASRSRYHQTVAGGYGATYVYWGASSNAEMRLSRLVYRDQRRKEGHTAATSGQAPESTTHAEVQPATPGAGGVSAGGRSAAIIEVPLSVQAPTGGTGVGLAASGAQAVSGASQETVARAQATSSTSATTSAAGTPAPQPTVVRTTTPDATLPQASLFRTAPGTSAHHLVETDPAFTDYRTWLSSDYLLKSLGHDPTSVTKRLGDGFYEQRLVREQVAQLTGYRYTEGTWGAASGAGAVVGDAVGGGLAGAVASGAVAAGITTLANQAAVAIINNQGNLGHALRDLGSSANVHALLNAVAVGGALAAMNMDPNGLPTAEGGAQKFMAQLGQNLQAGLAKAVISTAINGGSLEDSLKNALKGAFIDTAAAQGASAIGDMSTGDEAVLNAFTNKVAHVIAGCAAGAARTDTVTRLN